MKIVIEGKFLKIIDKEILRTKNVNSYKMSVEYDSFYNDRVLMIYFKQDNVKIVVTVGPDNIIDIPHEVLENVKDIYVGFYSPSADGDKLKDRYCSNFDSLTVIEGAYDESATPTEELSTTILEKYLQEMKDFYLESLEAYNNNAKEKIEEINIIAKDVSADKIAVEKMKLSVETSEQNAKASESNAKTSEQSAQTSAENAENSYQATVNIATNLSMLAFYVDENLKLHVVSESDLVNQKFNLVGNKLEVIYFAN